VLCVFAVLLTPRFGIAAWLFQCGFRAGPICTCCSRTEDPPQATPRFLPLGQLMILALLSIVSSGRLLGVQSPHCFAASDGFVVLAYKLVVLAAMSASVYFVVLKTTGLSRQFIQN